MKRTRLLAVLAIAVVAGLLVTGCKSPMGLTQDTRIASHWMPAPEVYTNWAGLHDSVGTVTVWNTPDTLYIKYDMTGNWWLEQTQAHVALKLRDIPQTHGKPNPDRFEFKNRWSPRVRTCTYAIPVRQGWNVGVDLYIAAHSVVASVNNHGKVTRREEAWAGPYFFPGGNLCCNVARYIKYTFKQAYKDVTLPTDRIKMRVSYNGSVCYFDAELAGVPSGFDVWSGVWRGWCGERGVDLDLNTWYDVRLWSSEDPNLPPRCANSGWDNVNYLLNHKASGASWVDVQNTAWYLLGQGPYPDAGTARQMADDAQANGDGWHPGKGQWLAVVCETPVGVQLVFIEVDP